MNKVFHLLAALLCSIALLLSACGHEHEWKEATCTDPATCTVCGETEGEPLGHDWSEATCTLPKTCAVCGATEGEALGHDWTPATHESPETCSRCGETRGDLLLYDVPSGLTSSYQFGEFDTFNSPAEENGLGGTMIWIDGEYEDVFTLDLPEAQIGLQAFITLVTDGDGNTWLLQLDLNEFEPIEKYEELEGHTLCILGEYQGFSGVYGAPVIHVEKIYDRNTGNLIVTAWYAQLD